MIFGIIKLYYPNCGIRFGTDSKDKYYHKEFGKLCSKDCFKQMELKYARAILGKDSE